MSRRFERDDALPAGRAPPRPSSPARCRDLARAVRAARPLGPPAARTCSCAAAACSPRATAARPREAQHLTSELVGRYRDDRPPFSAIALHAESSATTAIGNDYGLEEVFARQVRAHGRPGDVLIVLSTSGRSAERARRRRRRAPRAG